MDFYEIGAKIGIYYIPFLFALCFHEFSHGMVAKWRGDNTAQSMGRLTMNPMAHADLIGTFILPIMSLVLNIPIFFGWAKPVPVNARNLKHVRTDMFWIALAGPASNMLLAVIAAFLIGTVFRYFGYLSYARSIIELLSSFVLTNLFLCIFNLIPLHPLDGGKVLARFLPTELNYKLEQNEHISSMLLMVLILTGMLGFLKFPVMYIYQILMRLAEGLIL